METFSLIDNLNDSIRVTEGLEVGNPTSRNVGSINLPELTATKMIESEESSWHDWLCTEIGRRGIMAPVSGSCVELMQMLLAHASRPTIVYGPEVEECITATVGLVCIGWISVTEEDYLPLYRDMLRFDNRIPSHCAGFPTLKEAKAWIEEQWEEARASLWGVH